MNESCDFAAQSAPKLYVIYISVAWWEQILFLNMNGEADLEALMRQEELPNRQVL